jgi:hypothetical protein
LNFLIIRIYLLMVFEMVSSSAVSQALASRAAAAIEALIEAGAARLIAEPWRTNRIIRRAEGMTHDQLRTEVARRRALPPPTDFNRALALAQLARALDQPGFAAAWSSSRATSRPPARQLFSIATA